MRILAVFTMLLLSSSLTPLFAQDAYKSPMPKESQSNQAQTVQVQPENNPQQSTASKIARTQTTSGFAATGEPKITMKIEIWTGTTQVETKDGIWIGSTAGWVEIGARVPMMIERNEMAMTGATMTRNGLSVE